MKRINNQSRTLALSLGTVYIATAAEKEATALLKLYSILHDTQPTSVSAIQKLSNEQVFSLHCIAFTSLYFIQVLQGLSPTGGTCFYGICS
jgi:hypothetical protein